MPHEIGSLPYRHYERAKGYYFAINQDSDDDEADEFVPGESASVEVKF